MELSSSNLNVVFAATHSPTFRNAKRESTAQDLEELTQPNVKWRRRGSRPALLTCDYRDASGKWRQHSVQPTQVQDPDAQLAVLRECELRCQQLFEYNHVPEELEGEWSKLVD